MQGQAYRLRTKVLEGEACDARGRLQKCTAAAASGKKALECLKEEKIEVTLVYVEPLRVC